MVFPDSEDLTGILARYIVTDREAVWMDFTFDARKHNKGNEYNVFLLDDTGNMLSLEQRLFFLFW